MTRPGGVPIGQRPTFMGKQRVAEPTTAPARQHIWVTTPDGDACPGLLIQWQRRQREWWAHAIWTPEDGVAVQQWLPADKVRPASGRIG